MQNLSTKTFSNHFRLKNNPKVLFNFALPLYSKSNFVTPCIKFLKQNLIYGSRCDNWQCVEHWQLSTTEYGSRCSQWRRRWAGGMEHYGIRESSELSATALSERRADFAGRGSEANAHCEQARWGLRARNNSRQRIGTQARDGKALSFDGQGADRTKGSRCSQWRRRWADPAR